MMQSFLIISKNLEAADTYAIDLCHKEAISALDITIIDNSPSIGIQDIRELQKKLSLKPFHGQKKAALVKNAQTITPDAQNAFLKTLEEPPVDTYIFLLSTNEEGLLPTIRSRCSLVRLAALPTEALVIPLHSLEATLSQMSLQDKLFLAQEKGKNKEEALTWLESIMLFFREQMVAPDASQEKRFQSLRLLRSLHHAFSIIQTTNVSPRLILEHCFLTI